MSKKVLVVLTEGVEEVEAITPIDLLRRAGAEVSVASVDEDMTVTGKNGIRITADTHWNLVAAERFDLIIVPGGPGHKKLRTFHLLHEKLRTHVRAGNPVGAICAAPTVLLDAGLLEDKHYTAHFSVAEDLPDIDHDQAVVEDGLIITSQGAGTAVPFALKLIERLFESSKAEEVAEAICYQA